jgi:hypothetical protein
MPSCGRHQSVVLAEIGPSETKNAPISAGAFSYSEAEEGINPS